MLLHALSRRSPLSVLAPLCGALFLGLACGAEPSDLAGSAHRSLDKAVPKASARHVSDAAKKGFNPQPEPPAEEGKAGLDVSDAAKKGFNPQPEPPAEEGKDISDAAKKGFNPQPEPPAAGVKSAAVTDAAKKGFNPQPEPPAVDAENAVSDGAARAVPSQRR